MINNSTIVSFVLNIKYSLLEMITATRTYFKEYFLEFI